MVSTRACAMEKNKNGVNNSGVEKPIMKTCSNPESEDEDQTTHTSVPSGSAGSSIKVTLKKTRSCSSTSSRGSAHSFEVVRSVLPTSESVSGAEDGENQKDSDNDNNSNKCSDGNNSGNEKESEDESQNANSSGEDEIEILSSDDDSQESSERPITADVSVKDEKIVPIHTEVDLKTEEVIPPNSLTVKNEAATVSLKEELIKESYTEGEMEVKQDVDNGNSQASQPLNGIEKKETKEHVKEQKFKLNVRSFDDLAGHQPVNLINMPPPGQLDGGPPNYLSQNGGPFPLPFINIPCDVCGLQFDSSELLNEHKIAMKHFKCSFKECEHLLISSQHEFQEHQRIIHNIMPSPVQQLAHQVQRLPAMGFDQQLQSGVPPLPDALSSQSGVPNMYTPQMRMPNQPVPMQRSMRPSMMRPSMPHNMMSGRGRNIMRPSRGRPTIMNSNMGRGGGSMKRPATMPVRHALPPKRVTPMDRNSYTNSPNKSSPITKSFSETLSKSLTASANKTSTNQDVVNLFSKRGLTISTVDSGNNISLPAGLSLNSAVTIIPTSPLKVPNNVSKKVSNHVSHKVVPIKSVDTVDLTGPDKPREKKYYPCEVCSKTFLSVETLYEHISTAHKSYALPFKCNLCPGTFPSFDILNRHKLSFHKSEANPAVPYVIPILDFNKVGTVSRLQSMGVTSYIPVAQLDNQGGQFGVPIMSVSRPGSVDGLKYTNFFNLGCIRKL